MLKCLWIIVCNPVTFPLRFSDSCHGRNNLSFVNSTDITYSCYFVQIGNLPITRCLKERSSPMIVPIERRTYGSTYANAHTKDCQWMQKNGNHTGDDHSNVIFLLRRTCGKRPTSLRWIMILENRNKGAETFEYDYRPCLCYASFSVFVFLCRPKSVPDKIP